MVQIYTLPVEYTLNHCIKCNICVAKCPVFLATDLFPGPKYSGPQAGRFRSSQETSPDKSVDYCSGCRVCNLACPSGVKIAEMNARARARLIEQGKISKKYRLRNNLLARPELLGKVSQPIAPLINFLLKNKSFRELAHSSIGIHRNAPLPLVSKTRFSDWFNKRHKPKPSPKKVVYFHGCATQYFEPRVGKAAVKVLEANNFEVIVPKQHCCGLPLLSNGEFNAARKYHYSNIRSMVKYAEQGIPIVGTSTSCTLTLKEEAPELLDMYDRETQLVASQTYDFMEFLIFLYASGELNLDFHPVPLRLSYHMPCQYRAHRIGNPTYQLSRFIPDLELVESQVDCCGVAGTYGYKIEKHQIAKQVGKQLFAFVQKQGTHLVVCESETCRWQITHETGIDTIHPVELLAASYQLEIEDPLASIIHQI